MPLLPMLPIRRVETVWREIEGYLAGVAKWSVALVVVAGLSLTGCSASSTASDSSRNNPPRRSRPSNQGPSTIGSTTPAGIGLHKRHHHRDGPVW